MYKNIIQPNNWKFWIPISILFSFLQFNLSINYNKLDYKQPYLKVGDAFDYISSSNAYILNNNFTFFKSTEWGEKSNLIYQKDFDKSLYYSYRSPGYAFILIPLLKVFNYNTALSFVIYFQFLLYGISIYFLGLISIKLFQKKLIFYLVFLTGISSLVLNFWNIYLYTESFAFSFLIISIFLLLLGVESKNSWYFFFSGIALTESIMLRPFLAIMIGVFPFVLLFNFGLKSSLKYIIIFVSTFIIIDGFWTYRNFIRTNEFIPLASTMKYHKYRNKAFLEHLEIYHELGIHFDYNAWFFKKEDTRKVFDVLPKRLFSDQEDTSKILRAKDYYLRSKDQSYSHEKRSCFEYKSFQIQKKIISDFKNKNNSTFLTSRLGSSKILLNQGTIDVFTRYPILNIISNRIQKSLNNLIYYIGIMSSFIGIYRFRRNVLILSILFIPVFIFLFFSIINGAETREMFIPSFFMMLFGIETLVSLFYKKRWIIFLILIGFIILY
jgi:hypothetical protein